MQKTRGLRGVARSAAPLLAATFAALAAPAFAVAASPPKIANVLSRPLAADEGAFVRAAMQTPAAGSCDVLSPDPQYVEEMLVRFDASGAESFERRVAFVVGEGAYRSISKLTNPPNDAASMARMFRALGFTVYRAIDVTEAGLDSCFTRFRQDLERSEAAGERAAVSLFFYAGHGVQLTPEGKSPTNYMLAVDAKVDAAGKATGFKQIDVVLGEMRAHSKQALFLYDACRNAPFGAGVVKQAEGKAVRAFDASGAAQIESQAETATQAGLFIAYATSPGKTADDAWGPQGSAHSPFTQALLNNLAAPGIVIDEAMVKARADVGKLTADANGVSRQTPWTSSSKTESVWLNGELNAGAIEGRVRDAAFRSESEAQRGSRFAAMVAALKGLPKLWPESEAAAPFAAAKASLSRAYRAPAQALIGHQWDVLSAELSPDGTTAVTASFDNQVRFWDAATGRDQGAIKIGQPTRLDAVRATFSPDGRLIAVGVPGAVRLYDAASRVQVAELSAPAAASPDPEAPHDLTFSPDGSRIVAVMGFGRVEVFTIATRAFAALKLPAGALIRQAAFTPDGSRIATVSSVSGPAGGVKFWNPSTGDETGSFPLQGETPNSIALGEMRVIVGGADGEMRVYDGLGVRIHAPPTASGAERIDAVALSPDGRYAAFAAGAVASVMDVATGSILYELTGHENDIRRLAFSADSARLITASTDKTARIWDIAGRAPKRAIAIAGTATYAAYDPTGARLLIAGRDKTADIVDALSGAAVATLVGHEVTVEGGQFSRDGKRVVTWSTDKTARVWDLPTGQHLTLRHDSEVRSASFSPDGALVATASEDGTIRLWSVASGDLAGSLEGHTGEARAAVFSPDGKTLVSASLDNRAAIWSLSARTPIRWLAHDASLLDASFSPDGASVATSSFTGVSVWDAATGRERKMQSPSGPMFTSASFSPDGRVILASAFGSDALLWDPKSGLPLGRVDAGKSSLIHATFSPDGSEIATSEMNKGVRVWNAGPYGPELLKAAYALLTDNLRAEVERERVRYWEVDPKVLQ